MAETWTWISPDGSSRSLTGFAAGVEVLDGVTGRGMPPVRRDRSAKAGRPGSTLTALDYDTRTLEVPVMIRAGTEAAFTALLRDLEADLAPDRGDGMIRIDTPAGDQRDLVCRCVEGLELDENREGDRFPGAIRTVLVFEADRPFWAPPYYAPLLFPLNASAGAFFPVFPIRLGASQIYAQSPVDIGTDVEAYGLWTITGPGSQIIVENITTGRRWKWTGTLDAGETLIVDTRPREYSADPKSVRDGTGAWRFGELAGGQRDLWPFTRGVNYLRIEMSGATSSSLVRCDVLPQYLGA